MTNIFVSFLLYQGQSAKRERGVLIKNGVLA